MEVPLEVEVEAEVDAEVEVEEPEVEVEAVLEDEVLETDVGASPPTPSEAPSEAGELDFLAHARRSGSARRATQQTL